MKRVRLADDVVYRSFGSETVLLNLKTGQYHGVRGSGGRMLELLSETSDVELTARHVARETGHPLTEVVHDVEELCKALAARSLVIREDEAP